MTDRLEFPSIFYSHAGVNPGHQPAGVGKAQMLARLEFNVAIVLRFVVSVDQQVDDEFREYTWGVCRPLFCRALAFDPE